MKSVTCSLFCLSILAHFQVFSKNKKFEYSETIEVAGVSKDILFNRASMWIYGTFRNPPANIKVQDKKVYLKLPYTIFLNG